MNAPPRFAEALGSAAAAELRTLGGMRRFDEKTSLFHERQSAGSVLLLVSGRVKLVSMTPEGREVVLGIREPGDLVGEMAALDGEPRSAGAVTLEPVEAIAIAAEDFRAFVERTPAAALAIAHMLSRRLRDADRKRVEFLAHDTVGRVAARLVELCERFGTEAGPGVRIDLSITQEELAGWTGSSREATIKALRALRELGWIETERRGITVLDLDALRRRVL